MRAHGGPNGHQERDQRQAVLLVARVEIAVEDQVGIGARSAVPQVHQQEADVVEDVGRRHALVELEAVEQRRLAVDEADVAKMQVAMAAAHLSGAGACVEQVR